MSSNAYFLILQIQKVVLSLGDYMNTMCHACIGGTNVREDMRKLEAGAHVVVGTPGRVFDMMQRRALRKSLKLLLWRLFDVCNVFECFIT